MLLSCNNTVEPGAWVEVADWTVHTVTDQFKTGDMFVGDVDNNGHDDLVTVGYWDHAVNWFSSASVNNEYVWTRHVVDEALDTPADHELNDLDGDGDLDVVVGGMCTLSSGKFVPTVDACLESHMLWYENRDNGSSWEKHIIGEMDEIGANYIAVGDMDSDGDDDVVVGTIWMPIESETSEVVWFRNNLDEGKDWDRFIISAPGENGIKYVNGIAISDFDLDGNMDIAVATGKGREEVGTVYWFKAPEDNETAWQRFQVEPGMEAASYTVRTLDVNKDGYNDIIIGTNDRRVSDNPGGITFYINPGSPELGGIWQQHMLEEGGYRIGPYFNLVDMDNDEELDIISTYTGETHGDPGNVSWIQFHYDEKDGIVQDRRVIISTKHLKAWDIHAIDVNNDGNKDVAVSAFNISEILWYENDAE
ncbi:MAG: hypothetical protein GY868_06655 [Deltaproteobacteria bacterium]|nr:hypothetical protein [Deltaproteobacteria bacterium]